MDTRRQSLQGFLFVLPALAFLTLFLVYPTIWTAALSFNTGRGLDFHEWVGFDNYVNLFTKDRLFFDARDSLLRVLCSIISAGSS